MFVKEVLSPSDTRQKDPAFDLPKDREIGGLIEKGTVRAVERKAAGANARIWGGRFVLGIKNVEAEHPANKAPHALSGNVPCV